MKQLTSKEWWSCAGIRALKTFSQSAIGIIGASSLVSTVDWKTVVSGAVRYSSALDQSGIYITFIVC